MISYDPSSDLGFVSGSLYGGPNTSILDGSQSSLVAGLPIPDLIQTTQLNAVETPMVIPANSGQAGLPGTYVLDQNGTPTSLGAAYQAMYDQNTSQGRVTPAFDTGAVGNDGQYQTFVGSDVMVLIETYVPNNPDSTKRIAKQLVELHTLTISIHRETAPARGLGYINPKGFAMGTRTIAGTLIMTPFTVDVLYDFLQPGMMTNLSKDTTSPKVDQLPPFDVTILFCNEYGYASYRRLTGCKLITDGEIYSINDMMIERTISYMAMDFTPLMPITASDLYQNPNPSDPTTSSEQSASDLLSNYTPDDSILDA